MGASSLRPTRQRPSADPLEDHFDALEQRFRAQFNTVDTLIDRLRVSRQLLAEQLGRLSCRSRPRKPT